MLGQATMQMPVLRFFLCWALGDSNKTPEPPGWLQGVFLDVWPPWGFQAHTPLPTSPINLLSGEPRNLGLPSRSVCLTVGRLCQGPRIRPGVWLLWMSPLLPTPWLWDAM